MTDTKATSFHRILRASAISGLGSSVFILSGIIKTKLIALLLGPGGVGLFGLFQSILTTAGTISGMGINHSGVRRISEVRSDPDQRRLVLANSAVWWSSLALGALGAAVLVAFRGPVTEISLGDRGLSGAMVWIAAVIWFFVLYNGRAALLNGMHRIGDLARVSIASSLVSIPFTAMLIWYFREQGIAAAVAVNSLLMFSAAWWFCRTPHIPVRTAAWSDLRQPIAQLLGLGFFLMASNVVTLGSQYLVRVILTRSADIATTGYFQAAWSISVFYLGFAQNAMSMDYYPRLSALAADRKASNQLMNEQLQVAITLSGPAMLVMLIFTPQVVHLLFSAEFAQTIDLLRIQLLGDVFKMASWPLAFLLMAKGYGKLFFGIEASWNSIYLAIVWFGLPVWGIKAAGIAFFAAYVVYFIVVWVLARRINAFSFERVNAKLLVLYGSCVGGVFWIRTHDGWAAYGAALAVLCITTYLSLRWLSATLGGLSLSKILKRS